MQDFENKLEKIKEDIKKYQGVSLIKTIQKPN